MVDQLAGGPHLLKCHPRAGLLLLDYHTEIHVVK